MSEIVVEIDSMQYNILAVALDHMWEHLNDLRGEGIHDSVLDERIEKLKSMQKIFGV